MHLVSTVEWEHPVISICVCLYLTKKNPCKPGLRTTVAISFLSNSKTKKNQPISFKLWENVLVHMNFHCMKSKKSFQSFEEDKDIDRPIEKVFLIAITVFETVKKEVAIVAQRPNVNQLCIIYTNLKSRIYRNMNRIKNE